MGFGKIAEAALVYANYWRKKMRKQRIFGNLRRGLFAQFAKLRAKYTVLTSFFNRLMPADLRRRDYWNKNLRLTALLLGIWFVATFGVIFFARELNDILLLGFPFAYYMGAQGSLIIYVLIIWVYAHRMNKLDEDYGVEDKEHPFH